MARKTPDETLAQRRARTANARAAARLLPPRGTPEERRERSLQMNKIRWDAVRAKRDADNAELARQAASGRPVEQRLFVGPGSALPDDAA